MLKRRALSLSSRESTLHLSQSIGSFTSNTFPLRAPGGEHLCLSDLLDQDLSSYEYFQALPSDIKRKVMECDFRSLEEMQEYVSDLMHYHD